MMSREGASVYVASIIELNYHVCVASIDREAGVRSVLRNRGPRPRYARNPRGNNSDSAPRAGRSARYIVFVRGEGEYARQISLT